MHQPPEEERFKQNAIVMTKALQTGLQKLKNEGHNVDLTVVTMASALVVGFDSHYLIREFIKKSHAKCWDKINARDEDFFVENAASIFEYLPNDNVNLFKDLYLTKDIHGNNVVAQSLKNQIWSLFDAMIKISIKYIHKHRKMVDGCYTEPFFDDVNIDHHINVWQCKV